MSITTEAEALKRIIPLSVLPSEKLKLLAFECQLLNFRSGAIILKQGVVQNEFYAVVAGSVEYYGTTDGVFRSLLQEFADENAMAIGFLECFAQIPPTVGVRAVTDVAALSIPRDILIELFHESSELTLEMLRAVCGPPLKLIDALTRQAI